MGQCFEIDYDGAVATVTLTGRAMPPAFFAELAEVVDELEGREDLRVAILRGGYAKGFSYGLDLQAAFGKWGRLFAGDGLAKGRAALRKLIVELQAPLTALAGLRVPTIAAVHGWCIGGGVDLITACDVRIASADARFSVRETRIAIVADLGSLQRLPPIIGQGHTRELALTGRDFDAAHAEKIGLITAVHADREALDAAARALATEIAANPPLTVQGVKATLERGVRAEIAAGLDAVATWNAAFLPSEDLGEAVSAFVGRRPPEFKGR